jgi:hypothetical protein
MLLVETDACIEVALGNLITRIAPFLLSMFKVHVQCRSEMSGPPLGEGRKTTNTN